MMYMTETSSAPSKSTPESNLPWALRTALAIMVLGTLYLGFLPGWFLAQTAAAILVP